MKGDYAGQMRISAQSSDGSEVFTRFDEPRLGNRLHISIPWLTISLAKALSDS